MKKVTVFDLMKTLTDYVYSEVPVSDFESAVDLKNALIETLYTMVDKIVDEEFTFEEEDEEEDEEEEE